MQEAKVKALFLLAGFTIKKTHRLENKYWPLNEHYAQIRAENPWWLVETEFGMIEIGSRKRVYSIDWSSTSYRGEVTSDDTTQTESLVHAWTMPKALEYLTRLHRELENKK